MKNQDILYAFAHAVLCNQKIHTLQLKLLDRILKEYPEQSKNCYLMILQKPVKHASVSEIKELLKNETVRTRGFIAGSMIMLMCFDGNLDRKERTLLKTFFPELNFSRNFEKLCKNYISKFYQRLARKPPLLKRGMNCVPLLDKC